jgi:16S rRNA (guanine(966)-N(2))-methyltransferase RsmD
MRVITGKYGGRKFHPPDNIPTRPTTDFAKTGLFNILNNHIDFVEVKFLDLFAGTGSLSYEFASRGCEQIISVDQDLNCANFIKKTISEWKISGMQVVRSDVFSFINSCREKFDIIFAGPPYKLTNIPQIPDLIIERGLLNENGWFILETSPEHQFTNHSRLFHHRNYGGTHFHFFR